MGVRGVVVGEVRHLPVVDEDGGPVERAVVEEPAVDDRLARGVPARIRHVAVVAGDVAGVVGEIPARVVVAVQPAALGRPVDDGRAQLIAVGRGDVEVHPQVVVVAVEGEGRVEVDQVPAVAAEQRPRVVGDGLAGVVVAVDRSDRSRSSTGALSVVVLVPAFAFSQTRKFGPDTPPGAVRVGHGGAGREERSESTRRSHGRVADATARRQLTHGAHRRPSQGASRS